MVWLLFVIILALRKIPQDDFTAIFIDLFNRNMGRGKGKRDLQKSSTALLAQVVYMDATLKKAIMDFYLKDYTGMKLKFNQSNGDQESCSLVKLPFS